MDQPEPFWLWKTIYFVENSVESVDNSLVKWKISLKFVESAVQIIRCVDSYD